jgi:hypothetical protein
MTEVARHCVGCGNVTERNLGPYRCDNCGGTEFELADPPVGKDAAWLRENAHDLVYGGIPLNAGLRSAAHKRLNEIADRLSVMEEAVGVLRRIRYRLASGLTIDAVALDQMDTALARRTYD